MNENQNEKEEQKGNFELVELAPEQHAVTPVPKVTTELPFFYLTKQKKLLELDIHYEGIDAYGNPIRWEVIPNRSPKIGVPAIEAHTIFTRLIKPMMEIHRQPDGQIPEILPLGGIRQCLRNLGWKEGGWEARGLLQGLMQIGQATCDFDFFLPTGIDAEGKPIFKAIKGIFNRFSIWKIGSKHVSEEECIAGNIAFDFDLDDTLYIQLHRVERDIQRNQDQRYLDNQYMFSVEARGRRWYELLAAKLFGVIKNGGSYCEIKYSWYIKHHHTLTRLNTRSRVVSQMNRLVGDHIASGYITKIEYRAIKDEHGELDFLIRYYPGRAAKESVNRVLSFINNSTLPIFIARRAKRREKINSIGRRIEVGESDQVPTGVESSRMVIPPADDTQEPSGDNEILDALVKRDVMRAVAINLLNGRTTDDQMRIRDYIDYWDSIRNEKRPGLLVSLIQNRDPLPPSFETREQRRNRRAVDEDDKSVAAVQERLKAEYEDYCRQAIDRFISEKLPPGEFDRRVADYVKKSWHSGYWSDRPSMAEQLARHSVRAEISREINLPTYEAFFSGQESQRFPSGLEPNSSKFADEPTGEMPPNAQNDSMIAEEALNDTSNVSDQNSSLPAV